MYGPTPSIIIDSDERPPPESKLKIPKKEPESRNCDRRNGSAPGIGMLDKSLKRKSTNITNKILLRRLLSLKIFSSVRKKVFIYYYFILPFADSIAALAESDAENPENLTAFVILPVPRILTAGTLPFWL